MLTSWAFGLMTSMVKVVEDFSLASRDSSHWPRRTHRPRGCWARIGVEQQSPRVSSGDLSSRGRYISISAPRQPAAARAVNPRRNGFDGPDTERRHRCSSVPLHQILVVGPCFTRPRRVRDVARIPPGTSLAQVESGLGRPALSHGSVVLRSAGEERGICGWCGPVFLKQRDSSMVLMADRPSCPRRLDGRGRPCVGRFASFAPPNQPPSRPVSHSSTHVLDTVTEKECAACELPAVVTSAATISLHRSTHMLAEGGSWATKRWHRRSSLKRNQARVPWLLEFIRQYRGGHGSGAVGAGLWRRSERRPH